MNEKYIVLEEHDDYGIQYGQKECTFIIDVCDTIEQAREVMCSGSTKLQYIDDEDTDLTVEVNVDQKNIFARDTDHEMIYVPNDSDNEEIRRYIKPLKSGEPLLVAAFSYAE